MRLIRLSRLRRGRGDLCAALCPFVTARQLQGRRRSSDGGVLLLRAPSPPWRSYTPLVTKNMPLTAPGTLPAADYAAIMAYMLSYDCVKPSGDGKTPFPAGDISALKTDHLWRQKSAHPEVARSKMPPFSKEAVRMGYCVCDRHGDRMPGLLCGDEPSLLHLQGRAGFSWCNVGGGVSTAFVFRDSRQHSLSAGRRASHRNLRQLRAMSTVLVAHSAEHHGDGHTFGGGERS